MGSAPASSTPVSSSPALPATNASSVWTNHPLVAARHIYLSRGFRLTEEARHHSFGADLLGQVYELTLAPDRGDQT